ncbi:DNA polymerase III subunit gamma/tau [Bacillus lacus]|uniref:DNA-directed DNA polymerase n=1 Tax=Metabacillus lacus TaxID=1983721 RepID=A0A7X2J2F4_9BACI|nr:DNA polymerase III subunit gamma/tau [Metabacillus lacus]
MSYQALYRVWRPQQFRDVVGQEHITQTLQNALLHGKFSHAYLFSGPRGTGKTSAAKIFSKAVNCERAPVSEPCNECSACRGITDGTISDVIEIDAASNNGVDEIRDIRDKVKYAPSSVKYKVYIVDEVHMLSIGAFNALLKTLEEPPQHVIFILATTEPHKIPLTIISRCQRFDFKRITAAAIVGRMQDIIQHQSITVDEQALNIIASAADGGMRDALSLLDQAVSYSEETVTLEDALLVTGSVSHSLIAGMADSIHRKDASGALSALDELMRQGKDAARFIEDLIYYYRDMLLYQAAPRLEEIMERAAVDEQFKKLAEMVKPQEIYEIIDILNKSQQEMKWTNHPRIFLEVAMVRLCQPSAAPSGSDQTYTELLDKITSLQNEVQQLKQKGITVQAQEQQPKETKVAAKSSRNGYKTPVGRIKEILKTASRPELDSLKSKWAELLEYLKSQNKVSHAALLNDSEPVAASQNSFILKFKYEIHCKMVSENTNGVQSNIQSILENLLGRSIEMIGVPEQEWGKIREEFIHEQRQDENDQSDDEEDPLIAEAKKIAGEELIEIKD